MSDIDKTIVLERSGKNKYLICPVCGAEMNISQDGSNTSRCPVCNFIKKPQTAIQVGSIVINKYRILSSLASGAFGNIFLCHPLENESVRYVLKQLRTDSENSIKRFRREAKVLASLRNESRIAQIVDFWEEDGCMFIIMEYIRGINLRDAKAKYLFDEKLVWQLAHEAIAVLQYLWDNHTIIHRDIKPENMMLDENFYLKLLDFGLCKECSENSVNGITIANSTLGTPGYMSPEQFADSKHVDFRSDIFSLGATLFFLLTGDNPFAGETLDEIYEKTMKTPPPAKAFGKTCSKAGIAIIRRMMNPVPEKRFASYSELLDEIDQHLYQLNRQ